jgi:hypothetical protein
MGRGTRTPGEASIAEFVELGAEVLDALEALSAKRAFATDLDGAYDARSGGRGRPLDGEPAGRVRE